MAEHKTIYPLNGENYRVDLHYITNTHECHPRATWFTELSVKHVIVLVFFFNQLISIFAKTIIMVVISVVDILRKDADCSSKLIVA